MPRNLLITQCVQNDFVKPVKTSETLPNLLHIGHSEARRLNGMEPAIGPLNAFLKWAYSRDDAELGIVHLRDWHSLADPDQKDHLDRFGAHCIENTEGARFAFDASNSDRKVDLVSTTVLNDFLSPELVALLDAYRGQAIKVGVMGVWTEAKVHYLCYELITRYPTFKVAVCSALCASATRSRHFLALEHLKSILGVRIVDSVAEFSAFLADETASSIDMLDGDFHQVETEMAGGGELSSVQQRLISYLFKDCSRVNLKSLDGGFSGNLVARAKVVDQHGHALPPYVVKIGPVKEMAKERVAFEQIEEVLGNNAPRISAFADYQDLGAIKYRYASMYGESASSLQSIYQDRYDADTIKELLVEVFEEQLGKLYKAARMEKGNLFKYYEYSSRWSDSVQKKVADICGDDASGETIELEGQTLPNVAWFYRHQLDGLIENGPSQFFTSFVHGDLNGANIMVDGHSNVWLIDFFHTHEGHLLRDLAKFENDLLLIFTSIEDEDEYREACRLVDECLAIQDLSAPLPWIEEASYRHPALKNCVRTMKVLRSFYGELLGSSRNPLQLFIAQMRYTVHTLGFEECTDWQKKLALYASCRLSELIRTGIEKNLKLRVDWIPLPGGRDGKLGLTILPGRKDRERDLDADIEALKAQEVAAIYCLVEKAELEYYGLGDLVKRYESAGFQSYHYPIVDQRVPSDRAIREMVENISAQLGEGKNVVVHCVGGVGRSGLVAACTLKSMGLDSGEAIKTVRKYRGRRTIETKRQEDFVREFSP